MIIAMLENGNTDKTPTYLTPEEFEKKFTKVTGRRSVCMNPECVWWAKNGRHGSRSIIDGNVYMRVNDKKDDVWRHYAPGLPPQHAPNTWGKNHANCCGGSRGASTKNCNGSGCNSCP